MFKKFTIALLFTCLCLPLISAQNQDDQEQQRQSDLHNLLSAKEGDLLCRCISTFLPKKSETFYFKIGSTYHEVALVGEGISMTFPVRDTSTFTLYSKSISEDGEEIFIPIVQQPLQGNGRNHLIMLSRNPGTPYLNAKSYNLNTDDYPANSLYLFNHTELRLGVQVDKVNAVVEPLALHTHEFEEVSRNKYTSAKIAISYKGEAKVMSSKRLRLVPGRRFIMVCFPSRTRAEMGATPLRVITLQDMP